MENLKHLENRSSKEKAMWVNEIAKQPGVLKGCESSFFFECVGECLLNQGSTIEQKQEYVKAFYDDGCNGYDNREDIERIIAQMKTIIDVALIQKAENKIENMDT